MLQLIGMDVIPAINCHHKDVDSARDKVRQIEKISKWAHLDVADGKFTFNKTWGEVEEWKSFDTDLHLEVHIMAEEPEKIAGEWLNAGAKRVIVHAETLTEESTKDLLRLARTHSAALMIALNPETHVKDLPAYLKNFAEYQILGVHPGLAGQKFLPLVLHKIGELRREVHSARIEVDGGMNPEIARKAKEEGADAVVSASYILNSSDPAAAIQELQNI